MFLNWRFYIASYWIMIIGCFLYNLCHITLLFWKHVPSFKWLRSGWSDKFTWNEFKFKVVWPLLIENCLWLETVHYCSMIIIEEVCCLGKRHPFQRFMISSAIWETLSSIQESRMRHNNGHYCSKLIMTISCSLLLNDYYGRDVRSRYQCRSSNIGDCRSTQLDNWLSK